LKLPEKDQFTARLSCTLVVATWQRPGSLRNTLTSLLEQSYPDFDIVVVCDGEDSQTAAMATEFGAVPRLRWFFHESNRGLAAARNTGAREAAGDVILFMDDDAIAGADLVEAHMVHHISAGDLRRLVVCGPLIEDPERPFSSCLDRRLHDIREMIVAGSAAAMQVPGPESVGDDIERGLWCGLNCSVRREALIRSGGFNERFRKSGEEMELGQRLHLSGFEFVFEPRARVLHKNTKSWPAYYRGSWRDKGELDVYRVLDLGEKSAQTQKLGTIHQGYFLDRMAMRLNWIAASPLLSACDWLETAANRTEWHFLFGLWARVAREAEYWTRAKAAGCTLAKLRNVVKPRKCALMLHSLCEPRSTEEARYYLSPHRFQGMMRWLLTAGYKTANTSQWLKDDLSKKQVLLTFDDGYDDLYDHLLPLIVKHRLTALIFLVTDCIGTSNIFDQRSGFRARNLLTLSQIREMQKYGVEFGSHTLTHPHLPDVSDYQLHREVGESKRRLEDMLGVEITTFAYPYGGVDRRVRAAVAQAGYKLAFTALPGPNWWNDPLCQRRADVNENTSMLDFAFYLRTGYGFTQSISERLASLERELPTGALRRAAAALRSFGHYLCHDFRRPAAGSR
jgi:peptidoglycan/xylan/chitin deacetylase (PgdA/CDA1 family)/GT2 family glycosyltransferase